MRFDIRLSAASSEIGLLTNPTKRNLICGRLSTILSAEYYI